jgi:hypothetical protein
MLPITREPLGGEYSVSGTSSRHPLAVLVGWCSKIDLGLRMEREAASPGSA